MASGFIFFIGFLLGIGMLYSFQQMMSWSDKRNRLKFDVQYYIPDRIEELEKRVQKLENKRNNKKEN